MSVNNEIRFNKIKKILTAKIEDPGWQSPFQPMVIADMLTSIYKVMDPEKKIKFQYYQKGSEFGYASIPDLTEEKNKEKDEKNDKIFS